MTIETTYTAAREQLKPLMDKVVDDREVVRVRRRQGGDVAMVAAEELEGLLETAHLLSSPRNASRLLSALDRARSEELPPLRLKDLEARLEAAGTDEGHRARDPFSGIGKPEALKYLGSGVWSRRVTQEHRCVYLVKADRVEFLQGRYHY